jgi:hypothetical protein
MLLRYLIVFLILVCTPESAWADPLRIVVAVGHKDGLPHEIALKHADRDATRVRDVFVNHGGVAPSAAFVLSAPSVQDLMATLDRAAALARTRDAREVTLVFYFSGHGDRTRVHLGRELLEIRALDQKLATFPAHFKLMVVDACRITEGRSKGGIQKEEPFTIHLDTEGATAGTVRLQASADGDVAQESDELDGAIFTHYWVVGLLGAADTNGDGQITLAESYAHAYAQTLLRTARSAGVLQRPEASFELREGAPVVLTRLLGSSALLLPRGSDTYYLIYGIGSRSVLAEVWASPDHATVAAIPRGTYLVHQRAAGRSGAVQVSLAGGERRELHNADFSPVSEERLARKGGELDMDPNELALTYRLQAGGFTGLGQALSLGYAHAWEDLGVSFSLGGGLAHRTDARQGTDTRWLEARALLEWRIVPRPWTVRAGLGPLVTLMGQTTTRDDASRVEAAGYVGERSGSGWAAGGAALVGVRRTISRAMFAELGVAASLQAASVAGTLTPFADVGGSAGAGVEF